MKRSVVFVFWFITLSFTGCRSVFKQKATQKKEVNTYEEWKTVKLSRPEKIIYMPSLPTVKDTIIQKGKLKLKINYTQKGKLKKVTAEKTADTGSITTGKRFINEKTKTTDKTVKRDPVKDIWFLYIGTIIIFGIIANNLTKKTKATNET